MKEGPVVSTARPVADTNAPAAVIILAAGQGTRMKSRTPKVLHTMCGRTLLGHAIHAAQGLNPQHIAVVVRHDRDRVAAHALECDPGLIIADQDEIPGTGRAVWCGLQQLPADLEGPVVVMAGDTPLLNAETLSELVSRREESAVTILTTRVPDPTGYGRIVRDAAGVVSGVVEHKDASPEQRAIDEINTSTYVFDAAFLRSAIGSLGTANAQGEMYLTDVVAAAYSSGAGVSSMVLGDSWLVEGCNDLVQLATLRAEMNRRILEGWMRAGVSIVDPASTWIDVTVHLEADARVMPGTALYGATTIGADAIVGPGEFADATVGAGAVAGHVVVRGATIDQGANLAPFTVLGK